MCAGILVACVAVSGKRGLNGTPAPGGPPAKPIVVNLSLLLRAISLFVRKNVGMLITSAEGVASSAKVRAICDFMALRVSFAN